MATGSTGTAALGDSTLAALVESEVVKELRPANTSRDFLRFAARGPSIKANFVLYADLGPAVALTDDLTDQTTSAITDTSVQATATEKGFRIDVTDLVREVSVQNVLGDMAAYCARSMAEIWESDLAALMDDFTTGITTAASTLTPVDVLAAVSGLEQRDIPGPYVGYFDPKQTGELRQEIATTTASYEVGRDGELVRPFADAGWFGTYMGLPIWQSSLVVTTSGLIGGAVFASKQALGAYEIRAPRIESQRDASERTLQLVGTSVYGFAEISDTRGQTVKSVA